MNAVHALQNTKKKIYFGFTNASSKVHFRFTEGQTFYWSIMTVDDSIKCRFANSGVTDQVGGFQNPGICLQAFPSFLPHPLPALLLAPLFSRSLTLVPHSFRLNRTETLATQASCKCTVFQIWINHKTRMHLLALLGIFTDQNDRFLYPFIILQLQ